MNIQNIAAKTGLSKRMIRHYEEVGLIKPVRGSNNYREYSETDLNNLFCIKSLKVIGFSLEEIGKIINEGKTEEVLQRHLQSLLNKQQENFQFQKQNIYQIKKLLKSKSDKTETLLDQILATHEPKDALEDNISLTNFFNKHHVVHGHIPPVEDFSKIAGFGESGDFKIIDTTYITYRGVFEENTFDRASISMCKQLYSYFIVLSDINKKFGTEFHKSIIQQFCENWKSVSWELSMSFEAITEDLASLENIFSPLDLCILLTAENTKKERFQIVIPGQPLVVFLSERSGTECNAGRP
jgi:DNA-binding transcriptional MerR regulator